MQIDQAQRDVRLVYVGGFFGQLVSGVLWLTAAAVGTFSSPTAAIAILLLGGILIFPVTMACLRLAGRPASLPAGHSIPRPSRRCCRAETKRPGSAAKGLPHPTGIPRSPGAAGEARIAFTGLRPAGTKSRDLAPFRRAGRRWWHRGTGIGGVRSPGTRRGPE